MLRSLKDLEGYTVSATDGDIGTVENFFLDDERWTIRYLVVDTVEFLDGRQVLISPISIRQAGWSTRQFHLALTMAKIEDCPSTDMHKPVSRQHEQDYNQFYGYPSYWWYSGLWGLDNYPGMLAAKEVEAKTALAAAHAEKLAYDVHLRSTKELQGYSIQGNDEAIGHVEGFIIDDETWEVVYLIVNTSNWWFGKSVLIAPRWATHISWKERILQLDMSRESIKQSPKWDSSVPITREYEANLHTHFGHPGYWVDENHRK